MHAGAVPNDTKVMAVQRICFETSGHNCASSNSDIKCTPFQLC